MTAAWIILTGLALVFHAKELYHSHSDYRYLKKVDGATTTGALILTLIALGLTLAMLTFFAAGITAYLLPQAEPPPEFRLRSQLIQSELILGQSFIFLAGIGLWLLRRFAKQQAIEEDKAEELTQRLRDELAEEIRKNREIVQGSYAELAAMREYFWRLVEKLEKGDSDGR